MGQDQGHELHNSAINPEKRICPFENCVPPVKFVAPLSGERGMERRLQATASFQTQPPESFSRRAASLFTVTRSRALEVLEEIGIGIHDHHVTAILEACTVSFEAAIKFVKLRILAERLGVDL